MGPTILLFAIAIGIWGLDLGWAQVSPDAVVIAALIPISFQLAKRYRVENEPQAPLSSQEMAWIGSGLVVGLLANSTALMAFAWGYLATRVWIPKTRIPRSRLTLLLAGAFPWVLMDFWQVGWWFRLSGAQIAAQGFNLFGFDAVATGTAIQIDEIRISVEAACSGMNLLQTLLSGGVALTAIQFPITRQFWILAGSLPLLAWLANTARVAAISWWGLRFGVEAAEGAFHTWGAFLVLIVMFGLYLGLAELLRPRTTVPKTSES